MLLNVGTARDYKLSTPCQTLHTVLSICQLLMEPEKSGTIPGIFLRAAYSLNSRPDDCNISLELSAMP